MSGLGLSDGTGPDGIEAEILAVRDFEELEQRADRAAGKIVLFYPPWEGYGKTVQYRSRGASAAARHGAVACLIRSVTDTSLATPHTGMMHYDDDVTRIPAAAVTVEDAGRLYRLYQRGLAPRVHLYMEAQNRGETTDANVIGEVRGREFPEQIVLVGGHLDSWDVGTCAHDDGAGCVIALAAVRLLKIMDLIPRRSLRVVLFAGEEMGGYGGRAYREAHRDEADHYAAALESDSGAFPPAGFTVRADSLVIERIAGYCAPLAMIGADEVREGWSGVDIRPLTEEGVPGIGHRVHNEPYFSYHHSPADTFDKIDPEQLAKNVAAVAALLYAIADDEVSLRSLTAALGTH
jgi:carboxypeptidase Q